VAYRSRRSRCVRTEVECEVQMVSARLVAANMHLRQCFSTIVGISTVALGCTVSMHDCAWTASSALGSDSQHRPRVGIVKTEMGCALDADGASA